MNLINGNLHKLFRERKYRRLASNYDINGFDRIYFAHIRKTGGTSINRMFLSLARPDHARLYDELVESPDHRIICDNKIYVGWNGGLLNAGHYFYGFSHFPFYTLNLPEKTFTFTFFRDPVKRVVSHYNMLLNYLANAPDHPSVRKEGGWLGNSFADFLVRIPREHLQNQLFMFSEGFDVSEAVERIQGLSYISHGDDFEKGVEGLGRSIGLRLECLHVKKGDLDSQIDQSGLNRLREMLSEEYEMLDRLKRIERC